MFMSSEFRKGLYDVVPVTAAAVPIGMLWGTLAVDKGLSTAEATFMSFAVFAGAAQYIAIEQWREPVPWLLLSVTVFVVNLRHVLMGASLSRHIAHWPRWFQIASMFVMADENWAFSERRAANQTLTPGYYLGLGVPMVLAWSASTALGAALGKTLGDPATYGFDFAFSAMFIGILTGFWRGPATGAILGVSGVTAAVVHHLVPGAWYIVAGGIAGAITAAILYREEIA